MTEQRADSQVPDASGTTSPQQPTASGPAPYAPRRVRRIRRAAGAAVRGVRRAAGWVSRYFVEREPTFWTALTPALLLATVLFVRSPWSNYIFDEQEALLANPYVNGRSLGYWDAFRRDFWGLPNTGSIGSYRPIPNLIWRALWVISDHPWLHHWVNVVFHAICAAIISAWVWYLTRRRRLSWLAGAAFLSTAVLTEAVTGVVGIADVLGGFGVLLAVLSLSLPLWAMPFVVFSAMAFALLCKESGMVAVPLLPWVALVAAPALHPHRPWRLLRAVLALAAVTAALVAYTYFRRHFFPVTLPAELQDPLPDGEPLARRAIHEFQRWFRQPRLPSDPINNPLIEADFPHRLAGALRVYWRGLTQLVLPLRLSGDYSFPQEPVPTRLITLPSVLGGAALILPPVAAVVSWVRALLLERRDRRGAAGGAMERDVSVGPELAGPGASGGARWWSTATTSAMLLAIGLLWVPAAYFPHSNIPVLLPTVRAERFWYLPAMGAVLVLAVTYCWLLRRTRWRRVWIGLVAASFAFQAGQARSHALDYADDLAFWRATRNAAPNSAKAHLNYSVMVGARGQLEERLAANRRAMELAPEWPMARIYYGDTLCRMQRAEEAWPHYVQGFEMASNNSQLIALALQCLWDRGAVQSHHEELLDLAGRYPGTWLAYLADDLVYHGEKHGGVDPKYRPRGYNRGPKD